MAEVDVTTPEVAEAMEAMSLSAEDSILYADLSERMESEGIEEVSGIVSRQGFITGHSL